MAREFHGVHGVGGCQWIKREEELAMTDISRESILEIHVTVPNKGVRCTRNEI